MLRRISVSAPPWFIRRRFHPRSTTTAPYRGRGAPPKKGEVEDVLGRVPGLKQLNELPTDCDPIVATNVPCHKTCQSGN